MRGEPFPVSSLESEGKRRSALTLLTSVYCSSFIVSPHPTVQTHSEKKTKQKRNPAGGDASFTNAGFRTSIKKGSSKNPAGVSPAASPRRDLHVCGWDAEILYEILIFYAWTYMRKLTQSSSQWESCVVGGVSMATHQRVEKRKSEAPPCKKKT